MITFSIITCTFQAEKEIQRTLESVAQQTYPHVEHVLVDGASRDQTTTLIEAYIAEQRTQPEPLHRIVYRSEPDKGLYDAMNKGLQRATGDYVLFLNAGDTFPQTDTLEQVASAVGEGEVLPGVLYGDTDVVDNAGRFLRHRRLMPPENLSWRDFKWGMLVCHQAFYARTDLAQRVPYRLQFGLSADVDWCIRVMKMAEQKGLVLRPIHAVVVNYLDGGMSIKHHRASLKARFNVMRTHYGLLTTCGVHLWFLIRSFLRK